MVVKRQHARHLIKLPTEVTAGGQTVRGTTVRVSEKGFFVRSQTNFIVGTQVDILLHVTEESSFRLKGVVKYARTVTFDIRQNGMGIELTEKDPKYLEFIRYFE